MRATVALVLAATGVVACGPSDDEAIRQLVPKDSAAILRFSSVHRLEAVHSRRHFAKLGGPPRFFLVLDENWSGPIGRTRIYWTDRGGVHRFGLETLVR